MECVVENAGTASGQEEGRPVKIMVVEDVELNAEVLLEILAMEGFETAHAVTQRSYLYTPSKSRCRCLHSGRS